MRTIILASRSPERQRLLTLMRVPFETAFADINEDPRKNELPARYVLRLAEEKARTVAPRFPGRFILAADTTVAVGRRILGKAESPEECRMQMTLLSGRSHRVYTGLALIRPDGRIDTRLACARVLFKRLSDEEMRMLVESDEWRGVCVYKLRGIAGMFLRKIIGLETCVAGLPLFDVHQMFAAAGLTREGVTDRSSYSHLI